MTIPQLYIRGVRVSFRATRLQRQNDARHGPLCSCIRCEWGR